MGIYWIYVKLNLDIVVVHHMIFLIPCGMFLIFSLLFFVYEKGLRISIAESSLFIFLFISLSTQVLSLLDAVHLQGLLMVWGLFDGILFLWLARYFTIKSPNGSIQNIYKRIRNQSWLDWLIISIILIILVTIFTIAVVAPPNNSDSLVYHMARVSEWIQRESVAYYPTSITRQNNYPPLAEYAILHLQILSKSDVYANLVQWYAFVVSLVWVSLITKEFKLTWRSQLLASLFIVTLPMGILQSTSTQNDIVLGMFCLGFAYYLIRITEDVTFGNGFLCSITLGLALFTKGTAYVFCAGIGIVFGVVFLFRKFFAEGMDEARFLFLVLGLIVAFSLILNLGIYLNNMLVYNRLVSPESARIFNGKFTFSIWWANIVRNIGLHLGIPFPEINASTTKFLEGLLGNRINPPAATFENTRFEVIFKIHDDVAGNLPHLSLVGLAYLVFFVGKKSRRNLKVNVYGGGVFVSFLLFCVLLRWQPWASRLHTPLFFLAAPFVVWFLSKSLLENKFSLFIFAVFLFIYSLPFLLLNSSRPLLENQSRIGKRAYKSLYLTSLYKKKNIFEASREEMYFANNPDLFDDYLSVTDYVKEKKASQVGLLLSSNDWEYPFTPVNNISIDGVH